MMLMVYSTEEIGRIRAWAEQRDHWLPVPANPPAGYRPEHRALIADLATVFSISLIDGVPYRILTFSTRDHSEPPFILCQCIAWDFGFTGNARDWGRTNEDDCPWARGFVQPFDYQGPRE